MNNRSPGLSFPADGMPERIDALEERIKECENSLFELIEKHDELADLFARVVHVLQHKLEGG